MKLACCVPLESIHVLRVGRLRTVHTERLVAVVRKHETRWIRVARPTPVHLRRTLESTGSALFTAMYKSSRRDTERKRSGQAAGQNRAEFGQNIEESSQVNFLKSYKRLE